MFPRRIWRHVVLEISYLVHSGSARVALGRPRFERCLSCSPLQGLAGLVTLPLPELVVPKLCRSNPRSLARARVLSLSNTGHAGFGCRRQPFVENGA